MLCFLVMFIKRTTPCTWDNLILFNLYSEYTMLWNDIHLSPKTIFCICFVFKFHSKSFRYFFIFCVAQSLVVCVVFCGSLFMVFFVHFLLAIVLPVLRFRASDWPSDIWQLFIPLFEVLRVEVELCCRSFILIFFLDQWYIN